MASPQVSSHNQLYSTNAVAEACGVSGQTIKRWEQAGKIPPHVTKESSGQWFFTEEAKDAAVKFATSVVAK
jgi:DNA-binding transcriptional MerR regulator